MLEMIASEEGLLGHSPPDANAYNNLTQASLQAMLVKLHGHIMMKAAAEDPRLARAFEVCSRAAQVLYPS